MTRFPDADVCLILEGAYPYIAGGVSSWTHDLIRAQPDLTFQLVALVPDREPRESLYDLPPNVVEHVDISLQDLPAGERSLSRRHGGDEGLFSRLESPLTRLVSGGGFSELAEIHALVAPLHEQVGRRQLLDSEAAWLLCTRMYEHLLGESSFLEWFWSWRALVSGLCAILLAPLPRARVYHTISTGYAGLLATRARLETGRPALLTEHGIYTNERRIEIMMADWLQDRGGGGLALARGRSDLREIWIETFRGYARACYGACDEIVTLYTGNQVLQARDGALPERMRVIPNGIDYRRFAAIERDTGHRRPTIALIGRVVPIKDVKTYIRAAARLRDSVPDLEALVMGPTEEDPDYAEECRTLVRHLGLEQTVTFTGRVSLTDYLGRVDAIVLTSLSEAQPLVILEAGAAGVPSVATDVGSCRELIMGQPGEDPPLGAGGAVTPGSDPAATAEALRALLTDPARRAAAGQIMRERVRHYYDKVEIDGIYRALYDQLIALPHAEAPMPSPSGTEQSEVA